MGTEMEAAAGEEADASPLDLRHAPLFLFDYDGKATGDGRQARDATFFLYSIPTKQVLHKRVEEMVDHRYWTTPQGWLVMATRSSAATTFLWDPFTGARISLPPDGEGFLRGDGPKRCLLSRKPVAADPSCLVLVVDLAETVLWYCRLGAGGDDRWLKHEYEFTAAGCETLPGVLWHMGRLTSVGGKFFMNQFDKVVTLDFLPEPIFTVIPADMNMASWPPCNGRPAAEFVESDGDLFCVHIGHSDLQARFVVGIAVFKLDLSAQSWVRVESIRGRVFLVHHQFGASLDPQEAGLKGDCIYFCMPNDKGLYVYDMGTWDYSFAKSCFLSWGSLLY